MATLSSLPNELLYIICNYLYPDQCYRDLDFNHTRQLEDLYDVSLVNRRFLSVVEPILYARGIGHHFASPLAWAAKFGRPGTLRKALAAGASPDRKLRCQMTREFWRFANDARQATLDWAAKDPKYWPAFSIVRLATFDEEEETWAQEMSPNLAERCRQYWSSLSG